VYLTGRKDTPAEHAKTVATLEQLGFPVGNKGVVELNGTKLKTVLYKQEETNELVKKLGHPVAVFDNEVANARMFRGNLPKGVTVFRLATVSISKDTDTGGKGTIVVIRNFALQSDTKATEVNQPPAGGPKTASQRTAIAAGS
jgi:hypothetical protein